MKTNRIFIFSTRRGNSRLVPPSPRLPPSHEATADKMADKANPLVVVEKE